MSQVMESANPSLLQRSFYKQALIRDPGNTIPSLGDDQKVSTNISPSPHHPNPESSNLGDEDDIPVLLESNLKDMTPFYKMFLIAKYYEATPIKFIMVKCNLEWKVAGEVNIMDIGNGFTLIKFSNEIDCNNFFEGQPRFVSRQVCSLQRWKKVFDPVEEPITLVLLWVRIPWLPLEVCRDSTLNKILKPIGEVLRLMSLELISKGLFARVCIAVDLSKPIKMEIKYHRVVVHYYLLNYESIIDICYDCGNQDH